MLFFSRYSARKYLKQLSKLGLDLIDGGEKFAGGFRMELVENNFANKSTIPFEVLIKSSSVMKGEKEVVERYF